MKREFDALHFDKASLPMPKDCYDALMDAANSVKEEEPVKRASFRTVLIAAIIIVATMGIAFAAQQLGWVDFYGTNYGITLPKAAEESLNATKPISFEVGPMTFTYKQLLTDKRIVLSSAEVRMTDGSEVLIADDSNFYEAVDAISDTVLKKYGLAPGVTWVEAAQQLNLPLYGIRALVEVAPEYDKGEAMEDALWNEDGSIVYFNMPFVNKEAVKDDLPATLYMAVHSYDPATDEVKVNAWTDRQAATIAVAPLLAEKTYKPEGEANLGGMKLISVHAEQYATGIYLTSTFTLPNNMDAGTATEALYSLQFCDVDGNELPMGATLSGEANTDHLPTATLETMTSVAALPDSLIVTDGTTEIVVK